MKPFDLPPDLCADNLRRTLDDKTPAEAAETLEGKGLYELARHLRQGCDLVGHCTVESCVAVVELTQLSDDDLSTGCSDTAADCVKPV